MWNQGKRRSLRGRGSVGRKAHEIDEMTICHFDVYREWKDGRRVLVRMMMVVPRRARERLQGRIVGRIWRILENLADVILAYMVSLCRGIEESLLGLSHSQKERRVHKTGNAV